MSLGAILVLTQEILTPGAILAWLVITAAAWFLRKRIAKLIKAPVTSSFVAMIAVASIIAVTLGSRHYMGTAETYWLLDNELWTTRNQSANTLLNIVLFIPAGIALAIATKRHRFSLLVLVLLTFAIENIQMVTGLGAADPIDFLANSFGAVIGVTIAKLVNALLARARR